MQGGSSSDSLCPSKHHALVNAFQEAPYAELLADREPFVNAPVPAPGDQSSGRVGEFRPLGFRPGGPRLRFPSTPASVLSPDQPRTCKVKDAKSRLVHSGDKCFAGGTGFEVRDCSPESFSLGFSSASIPDPSLCKSRRCLMPSKLSGASQLSSAIAADQGLVRGCSPDELSVGFSKASTSTPDPCMQSLEQRRSHSRTGGAVSSSDQEPAHAPAAIGGLDRGGSPAKLSVGFSSASTSTHDPCNATTSTSVSPSVCERPSDSREAKRASPDPTKAPGSRASSIYPSEIWGSFLQCMSSANCRLSIFFHSLRDSPYVQQGPNAGKRSKKDLSIWPMPLPFLELLTSGAPQPRDPDRLALNAIVLVLDWLYLGMSKIWVSHLGLGLGSALNARQLQALDRLRPNVKQWNERGPFGPGDMSRAVSKFEAYEDELDAICAHVAKYRKRDDLPDLNFQALSHARPVDPSRLRFVGTPTFDPTPFLDEANRRTYLTPLDFAQDIPSEVPVPRVCVRARPGKLPELLELLASSDRLRIVRRSELKIGLRNGMLSLAKDELRDRMILDARPPNLAERTEERWIKSLGSLEQLQFMYVAPEYDISIFAEDLREFYHAFKISSQRTLRNALALCLPAGDLLKLRGCSKLCGSAAPTELMVPCLRTMAMGGTNAVAIGQTSHLSCILRTKVLHLEQFITLHGRPARTGELVAGLLIDDFVLLDPVHRSSPLRPSRGEKVIEQVVRGYADAGLPKHEGKAVAGALEGEFWGDLLDGKTGILQPNPKRVAPLVALILKVLEAGFCIVRLLEAIVGGLVSALQVRRRLLCLLEAVYSDFRNRRPAEVFALSSDVRSELLCAATLPCLSDIDIRAPGAPCLVCSDSSSAKEAAVWASISPELNVELCRHGLQRGLWSRLLKPLNALLRERGDDELIEADENDELYQSHPLWETLSLHLQFSLLGRIVTSSTRRHINIGELRAAIRAEERVGLQYPGCRYLHLQDSQVSLGCMVKGRSSSKSLNFELRRSLPQYLVSKIRSFYDFLKSAFNPADDPTRDVEIRAAWDNVPPWASEACLGNFAPLDAWLRERGMHLDQLRQLPPAAELLPDCPVHLPGPDSRRSGRITRDPEKLAKSLLQRPTLVASDILSLFDRLPQECFLRNRSGKKRGRTFGSGAFAHGGVVGVRSTYEAFPWSAFVINSFIEVMKPEFAYSSFMILDNAGSLPHLDSRNAEGEPNLVVPLSEFSGGGLWVETEGGRVFLDHKNTRVAGEVLEISRGPVLFDSRRLHATQPWKGRRTVLVAYSIRGAEKLDEQQRARLQQLGFRPAFSGEALHEPISPRPLASAIMPVAPAPDFHALTEKFQLQVFERPTSALKPLEGKLPRSRIDFRAGSLRVELPLHSVGSPRVEPACSSLPPASPRRTSSKDSTSSPKESASPLSPEALDLLLNLPPGRFVYSACFSSLHQALCSGSGWLDLFSGSRGLAKAMARVAPCWILCYDLLHSQDEDLLSYKAQQEILRLIRVEAFRGFSAGPVCSSFSTAIVPAWRTKEFPEGAPWVTAAQADKLKLGNAMLEFILVLVAEANRLKLI